MNIPEEVVRAASLIGRWAAENNVNSWEIGPCASRQELTELRAFKLAFDHIEANDRFEDEMKPTREQITDLVNECVNGEFLSHEEFIREATDNPNAFFGLRPEEVDRLVNLAFASGRTSKDRGSK